MSEITRAIKLAEVMLSAEAQVADMEEALRRRKNDVLRIKRVDLPELMRELGLQEFKLSSGAVIKCKEDVDAGIREGMQEAALAWLDEHGFGGLIKRTVSVEFGREEAEQAKELAVKLINEGFPANNNEGVHASTFKAFVRECLEKGVQLPTELFKVEPYSYAKAELPKKAKGKP